MVSPFLRLHLSSPLHVSIVRHFSRSLFYLSFFYFVLNLEGGCIRASLLHGFCLNSTNSLSLLFVSGSQYFSHSLHHSNFLSPFNLLDSSGDLFSFLFRSPFPLFITAAARKSYILLRFLSLFTPPFSFPFLYVAPDRFSVFFTLPSTSL